MLGFNKLVSITLMSKYTLGKNSKQDDTNERNPPNTIDNFNYQDPLVLSKDNPKINDQNEEIPNRSNQNLKKSKTDEWSNDGLFGILCDYFNKREESKKPATEISEIVNESKDDDEIRNKEMELLDNELNDDETVSEEFKDCEDSSLENSFSNGNDLSEEYTDCIDFSFENSLSDDKYVEEFSDYENTEVSEMSSGSNLLKYVDIDDIISNLDSKIEKDYLSDLISLYNNSYYRNLEILNNNEVTDE